MSEPDEFDHDDAYRYWQHQVEKRDPLGTMIIQGHALLEEEINAFIAKAFKNPKAVDKFGFYWKVKLVKAFHSSDELSHLWPLIQQLTKLRNLAAHRIVDDGTDDRIKIVNNLRQKFPVPHDYSDAELNDEDIIQMAFAYTTSLLHSMAEGIKAVR